MRRRKRKQKTKIPHLFGKVMVVWCVAFGTIVSVASLILYWIGGVDPSALIGVILAFFGGELALMFGKNALSGKDRTTPDDEEGKEEDENG